MVLKLPEGLDFRPMRSGDVSTVLDIILRHDEDDWESAKGSFRRTIEDQYVLTLHDEVVGATGASYAHGTEETWWLSWTYLDEEQRGRGLGRVMLETMVDTLRDQKARKVFVNTSDYTDLDQGAIYDDAMKAYKKVGFVEEMRHREYYDRNEALVVLGLRLTDYGERTTAPEPDQRAGRIIECAEIDDTDDAYLIDWEFSEDDPSTDRDVQDCIKKVSKSRGRVMFVGAASDATRVISLFRTNGFQEDGRLKDFYADGLDDVHMRYDLR